MKIIKRSESIHVDKPEGTSVDYYIREEYEIDYNIIKPKTTQTWHHHEKIFETIYILKGQLKIEYKENNIIVDSIVEEGDLVEVENTPHTFINESSKEVRFIVFKLILTGENKQNIIKTDKILD